MTRRNQRRPKLAVWKFASCDGCQLTLLDLEDELLEIAGAVQIAYFLEATRRTAKGPYDVSLVEGSITTPSDIDRIKEVRRLSKRVITIGACATAGGIQALRNYRDVDDLIRAVYAHPEYIDTLKTSTPIAAHIEVDFELRGCPISKQQLVEVIGAYLHHRRPRILNESVCLECKRSGAVCVVVATVRPASGRSPTPAAAALCPGYTRGCYGCFGPRERANTQALSHRATSALDVPRTDLVRLYRSFNAAAPAFAEESEALEHE